MKTTMLILVASLSLACFELPGSYEGALPADAGNTDGGAQSCPAPPPHKRTACEECKDVCADAGVKSCSNGSQYGSTNCECK